MHQDNDAKINIPESVCAMHVVHLSPVQIYFHPDGVDLQVKKQEAVVCDRWLEIIVNSLLAISE